MMDAAVNGGGGLGGGVGVPFPVVFFDGECETCIGNVVIHPAIDFRSFQSILSRKIGISSQQFSVYIADSNNPHNRSPITEKVNFSSISLERDCFFLVVLKRSRRSGTRKVKNDRSSPLVMSIKREPPQNVMLLRRDGGGGGGGGYNLMDARVYTGMDEFERRVRDFQMERERYLVNMGRASFRIETESKGLVCKDCENAKLVGREVEFHCCVHDAVVFGFRTRPGPIARPVKGLG